MKHPWGANQEPLFIQCVGWRLDWHTRSVGERRQKEFSDTLWRSHYLKQVLEGALEQPIVIAWAKQKLKELQGITLSWPLLNTQLQTTGLGGTHVTETNNHQIKSQHRSCTKKLQEKGKWSRCLTMGIYLSLCSFLKLHQNDRKEDPKVVPKGDNCRRKMAT